MPRSKEQQIIDILKGLSIHEANVVLQAVKQNLELVAIVNPLPASSE